MNRAWKCGLPISVAKSYAGNLIVLPLNCRLVIVWLMAIVVSTAVLFSPTTAVAQQYPTKAVRLMLRSPPGGSDDFQARVLGVQLSQILGQQFVVDYRAGAGGLVAWEYMAKVAPDGYTIMLTTTTLASIRAARPDATIDPWRDYTWISLVSKYMVMIVSHPALPVKNLKDVIALARKHPGKLSYGSSGYGATPHLAMEYFKSVARVDISHVPYRGGGPMYVDLFGGRLELGSTTTGSIMPHLKSGRIRPLGVTGANRLPELPHVPTVAESAGLPGFEFTSFYAIVGPANMPKDVVQTLVTALAKAMATPGFKEKFRDAAGGFEPAASTPEQMLDIAKKDGEKVSKLIRDANIKAE
jgi:tripartite-type tricarboxylate transporter receptor subunit TctC